MYIRGVFTPFSDKRKYTTIDRTTTESRIGGQYIQSLRSQLKVKSIHEVFYL